MVKKLLASNTLMIFVISFLILNLTLTDMYNKKHKESIIKGKCDFFMNFENLNNFEFEKISQLDIEQLIFIVNNCNNDNKNYNVLNKLYNKETTFEKLEKLFKDNLYNRYNEGKSIIYENDIILKRNDWLRSNDVFYTLDKKTNEVTKIITAQQIYNYKHNIK